MLSDGTIYRKSKGSDFYENKIYILFSSRGCAELAFGMFVFFGIHCGHAGAATINAKSPSFVDVTAAITLASDGDTVVIPGGNGHLDFNVYLLVRVSQFREPGSARQSSRMLSQSGPLIAWTLRAGYTSRLTGIEFQDGGRTRSGLGTGRDI